MNILHMGKWAKFGQPKMGSGRGQNQNFSSTGSIGSKSCGPQPSFERLPKPKMGSGRGQNQNSGTIGSKSCDPRSPFEHLPRRSKGDRGSQLFDPMVPLIGGLMGPMEQLFQLKFG